MVVGRRAFLAGAVASAAAVALTTCGGGTDAVEAGAGADPSGPAQGAFPRKVKHETGRGRPHTDVLTAELVTEVFGVRAVVVTDPVSGRPLVLPVGTRHADLAG